MTEPSPSPPNLTGAALKAALVVLGAWLILLIWLSLSTDVRETEWSRLLVVLSSLEAVAFAAAGALFGTAVQKQRVKDAHDAQQRAEQRAEAKSEEAADGRALAAAVKMRYAASEGVAAERMLASEPGELGETELLNLANQILERSR